MHNTILMVNIFFIFLLFLSYLSAHTSPQTIWMLSFFGLAYPPFLLANIGFVLYWILKRKPLFLYSVVAVILGWNHLSNTFQIRLSQRQPANPDNTFTFLSYNVRMFNHYNWIDDPSVRNSIYEYLLNEDPDILCMQEYFINHQDPYNRSRDFRRLHDRYKHIVYSNSNSRNFNFGIATFSKYPIVNTGKIEFVNSINITIYTDILVNTDTIRVYNNHLQSIQLTQKNLEFLDNIGKYDNRMHISGLREIGSRLKHAFIRRSRQVEIIVRSIENSPYPVIVTGDFNDTPVSYTYRSLRRKKLEDAFVRSGRGIGSTHIGLLPFLRIDYILHSRDLESFYFDIPRVDLSDHYPLKSEFSFTRREASPDQRSLPLE